MTPEHQVRFQSESQGLVDSLSACLVALTALIRPRASTSQAATDTAQVFCASGFLYKTDCFPLWITAGHVIDDINAYSRDANLFVSELRLADSIASHVKPPAPFIIIPNEPQYRISIVDDTAGIDHGAMILRPYIVDNLLKGPSRWITSDMIARDDEVFDCYVLLGFPESARNPVLRASGPDKRTVYFNISTPLLPLQRISPPDTPIDPNRSRLYFEILPHFCTDPLAPDEITSVAGMSGGPIFGVRFEQSQTITKLVGLQSAQGKESRYLAACPLWDFPEHLSKRLRQYANGEWPIAAAAVGPTSP